MLYSSLIFDFDGTLADSYDAIAASVNHVRAQRALTPLSVAEVRRLVGRGPVYLLSHTIPGADTDQALAAYRAHHPTVMYEMTRLLPGAIKALTAGRTAGLRMAVCSNKPRIFTHKLLEHLGIAEFFQAVLGPEDVPRPKPAPDMLLAAMQQLQVISSETLYVGDMVVDVETARAAGAGVWIVPTGSDDLACLQAARPDRLLRDLHELAGCKELAS